MPNRSKTGPKEATYNTRSQQKPVISKHSADATNKRKGPKASGASERENRDAQRVENPVEKSWLPDQLYQSQQEVTHNGACFVCIKRHTSNATLSPQKSVDQKGQLWRLKVAQPVADRTDDKSNSQMNKDALLAQSLAESQSGVAPFRRRSPRLHSRSSSADNHVNLVTEQLPPSTNTQGSTTVAGGTHHCEDGVIDLLDSDSDDDADTSAATSSLSRTSSDVKFVGEPPLDGCQTGIQKCLHSLFCPSKVVFTRLGVFLDGHQFLFIF